MSIILNGKSLTCLALSELGHKGTIAICGDAMAKVQRARNVVQGLVDRGFHDGHVAYGINTGFGLFSDVIISHDKLRILQDNLIRSHSAGVGPPLSQEETRRLLALRINVLAKGHSGIRQETLEQMVAAFNANCLSVVPSQGTVGASGDLAPLSHLALGLMGEGPMWDPITGNIGKASEVLAAHGLVPIRLEAKEGLAMINGTQMMSSIGAEATVRARNLAVTADIACALSVEALQGTPRAFEACIHSVRPHSGQVAVAKRLLSLLTPLSDMFHEHQYAGKVQDAYSIRCAPQVHGIAHDTIDFVDGLLSVELNSATDNPMIFTNQDCDEAGVHLQLPDPNDNVSKKITGGRSGGGGKDDVNSLDGGENPYRTTKAPASTFYKTEGDAGDGFVISGGNFHGEYPAKACDYLAIGVAELGNISERRLERLVNPSISGLPAFLAADSGLDSGFMIAHCTSAALVSENKGLCHPASVDTISTSGSKEDHVSMGGYGSRKAMSVVKNVEAVIAIEILAACQALEHHRPAKTTAALEAVHALVRTVVAPLEGDRHMSPDIDAVTHLVSTGKIYEAVMPHLMEK